MAFVRLPVALKIKMPGGEMLHIPEGAEVEADAATNIVIYGGFTPDDVSEYTFGEGENSARRLSARVANKRPWKNARGEPRIAESTQYLKFQGQVVNQAEKIRKGSVVVVVGHIGVDRQKNNEEKKKKYGKEYSYYPHLLVSDMAFLSQERAEGGDGEEKAQKAAPASSAVSV